MSLTIKSPSVIAVYLTVPPQFVECASIFEWTNFRRAISDSTFRKCLMLLCECGFIERDKGRYRQKTSGNRE